MAESFVFSIAETVLGKLGSFALEEVFMAWDVKSELKKLENSISTIRAVLLDAEEQQAKNHQLTDWLGKIKDLLYDAGDVLDEFQYQALRIQVLNRGGCKRKVCNFFSCSTPLTLRFKMVHKIKEIRETLDEIADDKAKFHLTDRVVDTRVMHGEMMTHSFVHALDVVIGRDDDKKKVIQLLRLPNDFGNVSIIPIVGIGGIGKTTLTKLVYNDERIVRHFELRMWVCVSMDFNVTKLMKAIIKSAIGKNSDELTIVDLKSRLRSIVYNKKFLLILDDVWINTNDRGRWEELIDLLLVGRSGSKIIVTTNSQSVASIVSNIRAYDLKGLSLKDSLSLFMKWAFKEGEDTKYPNLLKIGLEIVKKCMGIPLAMRTLGSLLYSKVDEHDWLLIKDNEVWDLEQKENGILPALKLSYDSMPSYLKNCFSYCSLFPKDHIFNDIELTYLWIAQGLIQPSNGTQELEEIGHRYFKELWSRSFFQDVEDQGTHLAFKMHDLVRDLSLSMAQTECSILNFRTQNIPKRVRHVSFSDADMLEKEFPKFLLEPGNMRTVLFHGNELGATSRSFVETCISSLKYLRVLDLSDSRLEVLPSSIGNLKHLRYLNLLGNRAIKELPNSICKLHNLQYLNLGECVELKELPKDIGNLMNLRFLNLTTKQMSFPEKGIERLISLRILAFVRCGNLESLPRSMKYLTALETLHISGCEKLNSMEWEGEIQGLKLRLRSLEIVELPQLTALPNWLYGAANSLQLLCIIGCHNLRVLPDWFQNLKSLQKLEINGCPELSSSCHQDWLKIAHVPEITLESQSIGSTYY